MGMMISISVIFDTGSTYSCSSKKEGFVNHEDKMFPIKLKGIANCIEISILGIVKYSVRIESGIMILLQDQVYYVPGLLKD